MNPEARRDLHRSAAVAEGLLAAGGIDVEEGVELELQSDGATEARVELHANMRDQALAVDPKQTDEFDVADRIEPQARIGSDLQFTRGNLERERPLDMQRVRESQRTAQRQQHTWVNTDAANLQTSVRLALESSLVRTIRVGHKRVDPLDGVERVDLQQELAIELHAGNPVARQHEVDAAHDSGLRAHVGIEIQRAGERAEHRDVRADRAGDFQESPCAAAWQCLDAGRDLDEARQCDDLRDGDLGLDRDDEVNRRCGRRVLASIESRRGAKDLDARRITGLEQRQERFRNLEDLIRERRVERHGHRAFDLEQVTHVRQADARRRTNLKGARDPGNLARPRRLDHDHQQARRLAVGELR